MSVASLVTSALLSILLWQSQLPPPPYGLPTGTKLNSDTTDSSGVRTINYSSQGNTVEIQIDLAGATTETTTEPGGNTTTRQYNTYFDTATGNRSEVFDEGDGLMRRRTVDSNGNLIMLETQDDDPVEGESNSFHRHSRTTTYYPDTGKVKSVTDANEDHGLVDTGITGLKKRTARTETFDAEGKRTSLINDEKVDLVEYVPGLGGVYAGTRTLQARGEDGKVAKTPQILDETQTWISAPPPAAPPTDPEEEEEQQEETGEAPARRAYYVALSPGIIHIALPSSVGYQWGARGGVEFPCGGPCAIAAGLGFQHSVGGANFHQLRTQAELMPGARLIDDRLFVFGVVGLGHVAAVSSFPLMGETNRMTQHGVALGVGAGVSYAVWRELYVGGRFGGDLQWFVSSGGAVGSHNLALDAFLGWRFGF